MPEVGGIVHTHSPYATAWAAHGDAIPCVLTAMADEFGGPIPCGGFALIGGEEIGEKWCGPDRASVAGHAAGQPRRLHHWREPPRAALKAAVMCEDVARTVFFARQLGELTDPLPTADIDASTALHRRSTDNEHT